MYARLLVFIFCALFSLYDLSARRQHVIDR